MERACAGTAVVEFTDSEEFKMSRLNIQHPITKQWRCFSTEIDSWVSEWLPEDQYKEWLIQKAAEKAAEQTAFELEQLGIVKSKYYSYNAAMYDAARMKYKEAHCNPCHQSNCKECKIWAYAGWEDYLKNSPDDFFDCKDDLLPENN